MLRYLDSGIYITAWRLKDDPNSLARRVFEDDSRVLVASRFVLLETVAKAAYNGRREEVAFYETLFALVERWVPNNEALLERAIGLGIRHDIVNLDALHVAAAERAGVREFVTTERPGKLLYRAVGVGPVFLGDLA